MERIPFSPFQFASCHANVNPVRVIVIMVENCVMDPMVLESVIVTRRSVFIKHTEIALSWYLLNHASICM